MPPKNKKYKSKKQLKKEGLMEKGGVIPSSPSWKNRMHHLVERFKASPKITPPPRSIDAMEDTIQMGKRKKKMETLGGRIIKKFKSPMKSAGLY